MFKRLVIAVAFAALTLLIGTGSDAVFASDGNKTWLTDGTIQGDAWQGLPDNLNRSAKFVVLDGFRNNGLGAAGDAGQRTTLTLTFDRAPEDNCVRVALFDPNSIGRWDQFVDGQLVRKAPDVLYEIFAPITMVNNQPICTEDLLLDNDPNNDPAPLQVTSAYKDYNTDPINNDDDIWVDLVDLDISLPKDDDKLDPTDLKLSDGRFRLVFRSTLLPAPAGLGFGDDHNPLTVNRDVSNFTGRERTGYKIAFDGTYLIPAGGTLGFAGGIIDERAPCSGPNGEGCGSTRDDMDATSGASDPVTMVDKSDTFATKEAVSTKYWYDGVFNFHLHSSHACKGDVDFKDADADWVDVANLTANDFDANGFLTGSALTGIPPENVGRYKRPGTSSCGGQRDVGQTKIPGGAVLGTCADRDRLVEFDGSADQSLNAAGVVNWNIFPIGSYVGHNTSPVNAADPVTFSSHQSAFCGRASYTVSVEEDNVNAADCPSGGSPFKTNTLDQATLQADPGLWCLQWRGLDCANFVFMQFNVPVGTTPRPTLKIDVFCDLDQDCERGQDDTPLPGGGVATLTLTEVDCDTEQPIVGGVDIQIATDANGVWTSPDCPALPTGCYRIAWDGDAPLPGTDTCLQLPTIVNLSGDTADNQCVTVEIPLDCTGTISGDVYCEDGTDCSYDPNIDEPLPAGTRIRVIATRTTPNGPESTEVEVVAPNTAYMIEGLAFDTYTVSYVFITGAIDPAPGCPLTREASLSADQTSVADVDFGFDCVPAGQICGDVYCEAGTSCGYDPQTDMPLPAGTKYIVTLTPVVNNVPQPGDAQTFSGTAPDTRYCFDELALGTYEITVSDDPASTPIQKLPALSTACPDKRTVTLTENVPEVDDVDFGYDCTAKICGDVYCENTGNCLYDDGVTDKPLPAGTVVVLTLKNGAGATVEVKKITAPQTDFCFEGLEYDTYTLSYAFDVGSVVWDLAPNCDSEKEIPVDVTNPSIDNCDFGFECVGDICGDVYCESGRDCSYDDATDAPLPDGTKYIVVLNKVDGQTQTEVARIPLTAPATRYCFEDQPLGTYEVTVIEDPTTPANRPLPTPSTACPSARPVTLSAQTQEVDDVDFGYICSVDICGNVYCEETDDCKYDAASADGPLPNGSVVIVTLTPIVGGQADIANQQTRTVTPPETEYCFKGLPFGTYEISWAFDAGSTVFELFGACEEVKTETVDASTGSIDDCDFGFVCDADLTGRAFCDFNLNGTYENPPDKPLTSATIQAQLIPAAGPLPAPLTTDIGVDGTFAFNNIAPGTYVLTVVAGWQPSSDALFDNVNGIEVIVPAGEERNVLLPFYCDLGAVRGTVYCDDDLSDSLTLGDLRFADITVTADGPGGPFNAQTNAMGEYVFEDLEPGVWTISVSPAQLPWNGPAPVPTAPQPVSQIVDVARGDQIMDIDFVSLCLGYIDGHVFQDPLGDCDGVYQEGSDIPVDGATIRLTGPDILPGPNPRTTVSDADGYWKFDGLPRGIYKVEILDPLTQKWVDLGLTLNEAATPREVAGINLPRLGNEHVDFGFCIQKLEGYVFQDNPDQDCDGVYQPNSDIPVDGATIRLSGPAGLPAPNPRTTVTDANGYYSFPDLVPGDYTVEILSPLPAKWEDINLTLVAGVTAKVQNANLPLGETERVDFGHCTQSLGGRVFKQPYGNWDDVWNPALDTGLGDILVRLRGTSGAALGYEDTTRTKAEAFPGDPDAGTYSFEDIPTGEYEVTIVNGDAVTNQTLSVLIGDRDRTYTPDVNVGDRIPDLDFPFCECEQKLCVNVFREQVDVCNNEYDENVDELVEFIEVRFEQLSSGRNVTLRTDADGRVCLPILEPGDYKVSISPRQSGLEECRPSLGSRLERIVSFDPAECEDQELWFGFCCCTKQGCCEGKLTEVVMETRFWVGCEPTDFKATASLFMDCGGDDLVDVGEATLVDDTFGSVPGAGGVVKIESIVRNRHLVTVRMRLTATGTRFPGHNFGNIKHLVHVTLNDQQSHICEVFRAEVLRPGAIPGCRVWDEELCRWVLVKWPCEPGVSYREVEWDRYECGNLCWKFGIVEICCFRDWCRCNCDCPTRECEPCKGNVTELKLRYDGDQEVHGVVIQTDDGRLLFEATIKPGDVIDLKAKGDDGSMGSEIKLFTNDECTPIRTVCHELLKIGTSIGGFTIIGGASSEGGPFCDPSVDANGQAIDAKCVECCIPEKPCDCIAGVTHLAFKYVGLQPKWAVILQDYDGRLLFEGMVRPGDFIRIRAQGDDGTMGTTIKLLTNEFCGDLDVTCREPIGIGTKSGPFLVVGGASRDGGRFCGSIVCKDCPDEEKEEQPCPSCPK